MTVYVVFYHDHFIAHFRTRYEAERFVMNCRLCLSYERVEASSFEIKEEFV